MNLHNRIAAFAALGSLIRSFSKEEVAGLTRSASSKNNWFTQETIQLALDGIGQFLEQHKLEKWLAPYQLPEENPDRKKVGVVMPGYVPLAGFHDFLAVLISGNELHARLSPEDPILIPFLAQELFQIEPGFKELLSFGERLRNMDAMIVSPGDNSTRYFEAYFKDIPRIIRKTRRSCAIIDGTESKMELERLGEDLTRFYGLGSRNVSKLFVPEGYEFVPLFEALEKFDYLRDHHKFVNNYDYNKSVYLINGNPHLDTGFLLFKEDKGMLSPISVVFYETYTNEGELKTLLQEQADKIQYVVGHQPLAEIPFGEAQNPERWCFSDKEDIIAFLQNI